MQLRRKEEKTDLSNTSGMCSRINLQSYLSILQHSPLTYWWSKVWLLQTLIWMPLFSTVVNLLKLSGRGKNKSKSSLFTRCLQFKITKFTASILLKLLINNKYCPKKSILLDQLAVQSEGWVNKNPQHSLFLQTYQKWKHLCCYKQSQE